MVEVTTRLRPDVNKFLMTTKIADIFLLKVYILPEMYAFILIKKIME